MLGSTTINYDICLICIESTYDNIKMDDKENNISNESDRNIPLKGLSQVLHAPHETPAEYHNLLVY